MSERADTQKARNLSETQCVISFSKMEVEPLASASK
jgi:hypothetical protein